MPNHLNDLTRTEIAAYQDSLKPSERPCLWCDKVRLMKADQSFCSPRCRVAYGKSAARIAYERLCTERGLWLLERESLVREIAELRRRLGE